MTRKTEELVLDANAPSCQGLQHLNALQGCWLRDEVACATPFPCQGRKERQWLRRSYFVSDVWIWFV